MIYIVSYSYFYINKRFSEVSDIEEGEIEYTY